MIVEFALAYLSSFFTPSKATGSSSTDELIILNILSYMSENITSKQSLLKNETHSSLSVLVLHPI